MSSRVGLSSLARWLFAVALLATVVVAVAAVATPPAQAVSLPGVTTYYSDGTYTTVVGRETRGCCGEYSLTGTKTKWSRFQRFNCLDVICPF